MSTALTYSVVIFFIYVGLSIQLNTMQNIVINPSVNIHLENSLLQIIQQNSIRSGRLIFDNKTTDLSEIFLKTVVQLQKDSQFASFVQWHIVNSTQHRKDYQYPPVSDDNKAFANSRTIWIFVFVEDFKYEPDLIEIAEDSALRSQHHLSLVLVICEIETNHVDFSQYLNSVWNKITPRDLIALRCNQSDCISNSFNPRDGLTTDTVILDNRTADAPTNNQPGKHTNSLPNTDLNQFVVKLFANHVTTFTVIDVGDDSRVRNVGFYLWTAKLLAEMLGKTLHVIVVETLVHKEMRKDTFQLNSVFRPNIRYVSRSLLPMDRFEVKTSYVQSLSEYRK